MNIQLIYLCFILIIINNITKYAYAIHTCSRVKLVPYTRLTMQRNINFGLHPGHGFHLVTQTKYRPEYEYHCCNGYEGPVNDCRPICANSCFGNGVCFSPGRCLCNFGYGGNDCQPICRNCGENSFCSKPGVCECKLGFARNDSSVSDKCHPICEIKCEEHAHCVAPEKCECIEGYSRQETKDGCQPICHQKCRENAFCQQPDTCKCNLGYTMNEQTCEPDCNNKCPENAKCIAPDRCECNPGYEKINGTEICKPLHLVSSTTEAISTEMVTIPTTDWPKSTMLQRRSISTTTTKMPLTSIALTNCTRGCHCWTEYDEMGSITNSKCFDICLKDNQKTRCLNLTNCHCYQENGPISCKDGDEDDSIEELQYICKVRASVVEQSEKLESQGNLQKLGPESYWPIIVGIIFTIGAIIFAGLAFYFYNKRRLIERHDEPLLEENL